jgi:nucleotide-binding universal stress UspA family protein
MVHCKPNHLYKFSSVAAISNRAKVNAIGNRGYEIVKVIAPVLNHAGKGDGKMFKHLLVPLDGSAIAECTLPHLVALTRVCQARVSLTRVLDCLPEGGFQQKPTGPLQWSLSKAEAKAYLDEVAQRLRVEANIKAETVVLEGQAAQSICDFAQNNEVDLILISSHGQSGLSRWNVSSVVRKIVQRVQRSVMIVRAYKVNEQGLNDLRYGRLLVPLDGSQRAECVFAPAITLARYYEAQLLLSHVIVKPQLPRHIALTASDKKLIKYFVANSQKILAQYMKQLHNRLAYPFESRLLIHHDVTRALHDLIDEAQVDLTLLSAHGFSGARHWPYGSVATSFIEYGSTPLLIVQDLEPGEIELTEAERAATEKQGH